MWEKPNYQYSDNVTITFYKFKQGTNRRLHPNKCHKCGEPHKHRNQNRYPNLCKKCALRKMMKERYAVDNGILRYSK